MRSHNKIRATIWGSGATGRALRAHSAEVRLLAVWLFSNDRALANPWGLYYCPRADIVHALGITAAKVQAGLAALEELHFARYCQATEWVWVINMAAEQLLAAGRKPLLPTDNMARAVAQWYANCPRNPWLGPFYERYVQYLRLDVRRDGGDAEAPSTEGRLLEMAVSQPKLLTDGADLPVVKARLSVAEQRDGEFLEFWAAYHPKGKSSRSRARDVWMKRKPPAQEVMAGLERWHASQRWADGFVVDAAKFLTEERWMEEPPPAPMPGMSQRTQDVVTALDTKRSIFDLEEMLPAHAREPVKKLRQG